MTATIYRVEVITSVQPRRRWSAEEKAAIVQETYWAGHIRIAGGAPARHCAKPAVSLAVAVRRGDAVGRWGRRGVPASEYRASQSHVRELQRLLGKKTLENEILREALDLVQPRKTTIALALARAGQHAVKTIADALGVARSNLNRSSNRCCTAPPRAPAAARGGPLG
jgi:transposase